MSDWVSALLGKLYINGIEKPLRGGLEIGANLTLTPTTLGYRLDVIEAWLQSSDAKLSLDQVTAASQLTGTIANAANSDVAGPTNVVDGEYPTLAWTVLLTIAGVDYRADYVAAYKRAAGVLTVMQEHAVFAAPSGVTITAAISGANQPELNIANATGSSLTYYIHHSTSRQVK